MTHVLDARANVTKPYGDVTYADPGYQADKKKRYPLDSESHCKAAWSYINMPKNAAKYTPEQVAAIKGRVKSALKKYGVDINAKSRGNVDVCVRSFDFLFEDRATDGRTLEGYAAVFNTPTRIAAVGGDFEEVILPGAFVRSLAQRTPVLQFDHGKDPKIGGVPIGSIESLAEDEQGLHVRARLYDHPDIERLRQAIAGKSITGMSFRFQVPKNGDTWTKRSDDALELREIRDADIHELGPVVFPAYDSTSVSVRSLLAQLDPAEYQILIRELAAQFGLAVDLNDFTGRSDTRSVDGGGPDAGVDDDNVSTQRTEFSDRIDGLRERYVAAKAPLRV